MAIDLKLKSEELKNLVSQYDSKYFMGELGSMMDLISFDSPSSGLVGLSSPLRQLSYIIGLNISSEITQETLKTSMNNEDWDEIRELLIEIENGYIESFSAPKGQVLTEEEIKRRVISVPTFLNYFNQGSLNYEEQIIERIERYFEPFENKIVENFGLSIADFIEIYNTIDAIPNEFLAEKINPKETDQTWKEFASDMISQGKRPDEWMEHMPDRFKNLFSFMHNKGQIRTINTSSISNKFGNDKLTTFINIFKCDRKETDFLFYTQLNPLTITPIYKINDDEFLFVRAEFILQAIYNTLQQFCVSNGLSEQFYRKRGKELEKKVIEVFTDFIGSKNVEVFSGVYTEKGHEQDLILIAKNLVLIVEMKASRRVEPMRDPDKAYDRIVTNFDESIQKGYDQSFRVKENFLDNETLHLYSDEKLLNKIKEINTKHYHNVFSIVVTQERYGLIQSDLKYLLEIYEDDEYPWSVCIDDLETFLLYLSKKKKTSKDLIMFLSIREKLHGHLICGDEMECCGAYCVGRLDYKFKKNKEDDIFVLTPDLATCFDYEYQNKGLGFKNEKNLHLKNKNYRLLGGANKLY